MFKSDLIEECGPELMDAVYERHLEIVEFYYEVWQDVGDDVIVHFFPPGFMERDPERARKVFRELWDIVNSLIPRNDPDAIHCYVMYRMIEAWFDDEYNQLTGLLPDEVKEYAERLGKPQSGSESDESDEEEDPSEAELIQLWFTDKDTCLGDFEDTYDQDYMDETIAEAAAELYLSETGIPHYLGADIRELVDLLPGDLYEKVTAKLLSEQKQSESLFQAILVACEGISNNALDYQDFSENALNRQVRDTLRDRLQGYEVHDQTQQGTGENGQEEGSLDILIKRNGLNEAIYEGLIHDDHCWLEEHIEKATGRYNPSGCRRVYIGEYYQNQDFRRCWENTVEYLCTQHQGKEIETGRNGIRIYQFDLEQILVSVIGMNMCS